MVKLKRLILFMDSLYMLLTGPFLLAIIVTTLVFTYATIVFITSHNTEHIIKNLLRFSSPASTMLINIALALLASIPFIVISVRDRSIVTTLAPISRLEIILSLELSSIAVLLVIIVTSLIPLYVIIPRKDIVNSILLEELALTIPTLLFMMNIASIIISLGARRYTHVLILVPLYAIILPILIMIIHSLNLDIINEVLMSILSPGLPIANTLFGALGLYNVITIDEEVKNLLSWIHIGITYDLMASIISLTVVLVIGHVVFSKYCEVGL